MIARDNIQEFILDHIRSIDRRVVELRSVESVEQWNRVPRWWRENKMTKWKGIFVLAATLVAVAPVTAGAQDHRGRPGGAPARAAP
ncbi:MAG TPA: hypothetical protein VJR71_00535, partial [Pseudolabrys sp.]|nr:hypothetical protein [Pseudolabrys sp.]